MDSFILYNTKLFSELLEIGILFHFQKKKCKDVIFSSLGYNICLCSYNLNFNIAELLRNITCF